MTKARPTRFPPRRSSLWFVALLLLGSAGLRVFENTDVLVALAAETDVDGGSGAPLFTQMTDGMDMGGEGALNLERILVDLRAREDMLMERETALADRMEALQAAEAEISRNLQILQMAEEELEATIALAATAAEDDLAQLTTVYENMKPKEAASVFEEMAPDFAAGFIARMRPDAAASVMAGLKPETAYSISVILAGRNAEVPKN